MKWVIFHGVFGDWGWELLDERDAVVRESHHHFETREDAERDARRHGYVATPADVRGYQERDRSR